MDRNLAEFSGRIPSRLKLKGFEKRFIFKEAMKGILPSSILHKKEAWLRCSGWLLGA